MKQGTRLSVHEAAAIWWLIGAPFVFAPAVAASPRDDAAGVCGWGVAIVTAMILVVPVLLRWPAFRRCYGWTDALSDDQRQALKRRNVCHYYRIAFDDGYPARVKPYCLRIIWTAAAFIPVTLVLPGGVRPEVDALIVFGAWYPIGVSFLVLASLPLGRLLEARNERH